jgi:hypothetical protein
MENKTHRKIAYIGLILMLSGYVFGVIETLYFGSNWLPESREELICDCISLLVSGSGCGLFVYAITRITTDKIDELFKKNLEDHD